MEPPYRTASAREGNSDSDDSLAVSVIVSCKGHLDVQVNSAPPSKAGRQWCVTISASTRDGHVLLETADMSTDTSPTKREEWQAFKSLVDRAWAEFDRAVADMRARLR